MSLRILHAALPIIEGLMSKIGGPWEYQLVREGPLVFDRVFCSTAEGRRFMLHNHERNHEQWLWHQHSAPIAVIGRGRYEMGIGSSAPPEERRHVPQARTLFDGIFAYELTGIDSWHAVRTLSACQTIVLFGRTRDLVDEEPLPLDLSAAAPILDAIPGFMRQIKEKL